MPHLEHKLMPDEYYSAKDIDRLFVALEKRFQAREIMRIEEAAKFLSISRRKVDDLCRAGKLPYHMLDGLGGKFFLRSELIEKIKAS